MLLNKKQATDLAKAWRLGNKFRKKSLTKKHDLAPATSKNTGRVKMGIRMDIESKPREYYPAIDDDGNLVFFTGNPMKRIPLSDLFTPPKAGKNRTRVPAKENAMINHKLETLKTSFPNEDVNILESFLEQYPFELKEFSLYKIRPLFNSFKENILERTEYQLVAQKTDGTEIKSAFYKTENELADMQQKCEDSDEYESTTVLKRIVDVDEDEEDEESMGGVYNNEVDYTDGAAIEDDQDFSEDKYGPGGDRHELFTLTNLALRQIPGSPKQRATIKKLNKIRVKLGMKPLKEMDIDINDEVNESFKTEVSEEDTIDEIKVFDKLRFKGADKKLALSVVDMIKKKANPKEIAKSFKKLKLPAQELIMKTLGDKSAQDLLQKGQLINQLVSIFDQAEPKGLDGRSKEFRNKIKKLEYNKNKKTKAYEVWGESTELDEYQLGYRSSQKGAMKFWKVTITKKAGKLFKGQNVVTKARNSAEAIKKGIKQMKGNPALVPSGSVTAELDEGAKKVVKEKKLKALQTKSDKTGIPYGILKQVFNRGVAAWRTGHRPGTNPTQWGYARVNSFATKSKGTWGGADKDLAAKARGSMKKKK